MQVVVRVVQQTEKAFRVTDGEVSCWIPKSMAKTEDWDFGLVEVPLDIVERHGLLTPLNWEPASSTKDATLYVLREAGYSSKRMGEWLNCHDKKLSVWLRRRWKQRWDNHAQAT